MEINYYWIALGSGAFLVCVLAVLIVKSYGILQVRWLNVSRLREFQQRASATSDPAERTSLNVITERCQALRGRWVLGEADLAVIENTRSLVREIAELYHPQSKQPLAEARIEKILNAFLEMKTHILQLTRLRGIREWTRFRLRHLVWLSEPGPVRLNWSKLPRSKPCAVLS